MSHFSVLVVGEAVEEQLQPFHEFECTGIDDEYVQNVDITDKVLERIEKEGVSLDEALGYWGIERESIVDAFKGSVDIFSKAHKYGFAIVECDSEGNERLLKAVNRTNPNKKWDWYVIGGRWGGMLLLKDYKKGVRIRKGSSSPWENSHTNDALGGVDVARKGRIDFEAMRVAAETEAEKRWEAVRDTCEGQLWKSWEQCLDLHNNQASLARDFYHNQEAIRLLNKSEYFFNLDQYLLPLDTYKQNARNETFVTFAVILDSASRLGRGLKRTWASNTPSE